MRLHYYIFSINEELMNKFSEKKNVLPKDEINLFNEVNTSFINAFVFYIPYVMG